MKWTSSVASTLRWSGAIINESGKREAAAAIALRVCEGDTIGFGSGSTCFLAIQAIAQRIRAEGLSIRAIPTSTEIQLTCTALDIPTTSLFSARPDWSFDGADEVDTSANLIKGRGGAMTREKILMRSSPENYIIIDSTKRVSKLGSVFPVPIEVLPEACHLVEESLVELGASEVILRYGGGKDGPVITEAGNCILDARFPSIGPTLESDIKLLSGVVESGLFLGYSVQLVIAGTAGDIPRGGDDV